MAQPCWRRAGAGLAPPQPSRAACSVPVRSVPAGASSRPASHPSKTPSTWSDPSGPGSRRGSGRARHARTRPCPSRSPPSVRRRTATASSVHWPGRGGRSKPALSAFAWDSGAPGPAALVDTRHEYTHLFSIYVPIAIGVFAVIVLVAAYAIARFRRRAPEHAARWHEHNPLEGAYAVILTLVVVFLLYLTFTAEHRVDTVANLQRPSLIVNVTGAKWEW